MTGSGASTTVNERSTAAGMRFAVVIVRYQPRPMLPESKPESSTINSDHVPFGLDPLKVAKVESYGEGGAGEGKRSPSRKLVGLFVPETICAESGNEAAAASSNVSVTLLSTLPPPQSDIK